MMQGSGGDGDARSNDGGAVVGEVEVGVRLGWDTGKSEEIIKIEG